MQDLEKFVSKEELPNFDKKYVSLKKLNLPKVEIEADAIHIWEGDRLTTFKIVDLAQSQFSINGKDFNLQLEKSLPENLERLKVFMKAWESLSKLEWLLPRANAGAIVVAIVIVAGWLAISAMVDHNHVTFVADDETLRGINSLCKDELQKKRQRNFPDRQISRQTFDNMTKINRSFCASYGSAPIGSAISLVHLFGQVSKYSMCDLAEDTQKCFWALNLLLENDQQKISPDFQSKVDELLKKLKYPSNIQTEVPNTKKTSK